MAALDALSAEKAGAHRLAAWRGWGLQRTRGGALLGPRPSRRRTRSARPVGSRERARRRHAGSALSGTAAACARCSACSWYSESPPSLCTCCPRGCPWGGGWRRPGSLKAGECEGAGRRPAGAEVGGLEMMPRGPCVSLHARSPSSPSYLGHRGSPSSTRFTTAASLQTVIRSVLFLPDCSP